MLCKNERIRFSCCALEIYFWCSFSLIMCQIKIVVHGLNVIAGEKTAGEPSTNNDATDPDIDVDIAGVCQLSDKVQVRIPGVQ